MPRYSVERRRRRHATTSEDSSEESSSGEGKHVLQSKKTFSSKKRRISRERSKSLTPKQKFDPDDSKKKSVSGKDKSQSASPKGFGGVTSSSGEVSDSSGDESRKKAVRSTVRRTATSRIELPKSHGKSPRGSASSADSSDDEERSSSPKHGGKSESESSDDDGHEKPDWYKRRSWTPEEQRRPQHRRSHSQDRYYSSRRDRRSADRHRNGRSYNYDRRDDIRHDNRRYDDRRRDDRRHDDRRRDDRSDRPRSRNNIENRRGNRDDEKENKGEITDGKMERNAVPKKDKEDTLTTRTGGAYIPPARLRMMQQAITDKSSVEYQRMSWEALKKSINGLVNKVNIGNIDDIVRELLEENVIRGRGLLCRSITQAQTASPTFTHVYAAVVAVVNSKFPQIGELLLRRVVLQFRKGFRRNDKNVCVSSTRFMAHLVNQQVAHEILALEVLTLLLEKATDDSVEIAVGFMKECGHKLTEVSPRGVNAIFERFRAVLHEAEVDTRVQYMIEVLMAVRKDKFKDHVAIAEGLELIEEDEQITHLLTLEDVTAGEEMLNIFKADPEFQENEAKYKELKNEILDQSGSDSDSGSSGESESSESEEEDQHQTILDQTETNIIGLRRQIYLTLQSSLDYEEAVHKMLKLSLKPGQEVELCNMVLDCCAQQRTYEKFYGLIAQRLCMLAKKYVEPFEQMFMDQYETCHRLDPTKLRNVSKFMGHLLHTDAISWGVLQTIKMNEDDTTSSSRIFVKSLFLELAEYMGLPKLNERLRDQTLQQYFEGIMPKDHPKKTRFAINFFTSIGLGGLTDGLREHLKNAPRPAPVIKPIESSSTDSSSSSSSDSSDTDSSSDSSSD